MAGRSHVLIRWFALAAAIALAWPLRDNTWSGLILPALSPVVALSGIAATRAAGIVALLALPVALLAFLVARPFCRFACPVGFLMDLLRRLRPSWPSATRRVPKLGGALLLATLASACIGYPALLWLDPLALFNGALNAWRTPLALISALPALGLLLVLALDFALPGVWCAKLCPLGALQDAQGWIRNRSRRPAVRAPTFQPARRTFLATSAGIAAGLAARRVAGGDERPLRPPGSVGEDGFSGLCIRCGNCAQVCPPRIIRPALGEHGVLNLFTPVLTYDTDYCHEGCNRCNEVCPSGAIARLPLADKKRQIIGIAAIDLDTCQLANGRECTACIRKCPYGAITAQSLDEGFTTVPVVKRSKCNGCGACESVCPVRPVRSIRVARG